MQDSYRLIYASGTVFLSSAMAFDFLLIIPDVLTVSIGYSIYLPYIKSDSNHFECMYPLALCKSCDILICCFDYKCVNNYQVLVPYLITHLIFECDTHT